MPNARRILHFSPRRPRRAMPPRWFAAARLLGLALLFLLPMQMRAGDNDPHPHAMLHLLLDARDGVIDHHETVASAPDHGPHGAAAASPEPDVAKTSSSNVSGGAMALLAVVVTALGLLSLRRMPVWPRPAPWGDWLPALEPPPPRVPAA